jgi:chemotaxis protein methyltransferase CheR
MIATLHTREVERFRDLIGRSLGLQFDDAKLGFLAEVLRRRLDVSGQRADGYLARLEAKCAPEDLRHLAEELTVGETYFFRHLEQYRALTAIALPDRLRSAQAGGRALHVLSAGCASGEEPYSLAMAITEAALDRGTSVAIRGVDINPAVLDKAMRARFSPWALRDTPPDLQRRWFRPDGREFILDERVRSAVRFDVCNLADEHEPLWQPESQDIVFCRNVVMYFTPAAAQAFVGRLARVLRPGGYLFLGHAETLRGLSNDFQLLHTHGTFYYQRLDAAATPSTSVSDARAALPDAPAMIADLMNGTWVESIRRAAERIEHLTRPPGQPRVSRRSSTGRSARPGEIGLVLELLKEERFTDALGLVETLPPDAVNDPEVLLLRAVLLTHSGRLADAERACERLLSLDQLNAGAHYLLALCREGAGDAAGAIYHDQVAVYLDPGFAMPHVHLGVLGRRADDRTTARREFEQAIMLLQREDTSRILLFGGGFSRDALVALCRAELLGSGAGRE